MAENAGSDWIGRRRERPARPSRLAEYLLRDEPQAPPAADEVAGELARTRRRLAELEARLEATEEELRVARAADAAVLFGEPPAAEPPPRPVRALERRYEPGRAYWLRRCQGFRVARESRTLGTVSGIRYRASVDEPDLLEVRTAFAQRRLLRVDDVERIDARAREIVLRAQPAERRNVAATLLDVVRSRRQAARSVGR